MILSPGLGMLHQTKDALEAGGDEMKGLEHFPRFTPPYNLAGVRAYEKAGFKFVGRLRQNKSMGGRLWDTIVMDILAVEFESPVLARVLAADESR